MRNRNPWFYRSTVPAAVSLAAMLMGQPAEAQQAVDPMIAATPVAGARGDDYRHPKGDQKRLLRQKGLQAKLQGKAAGKVHQVAKGQYVELEREGEDLIWTVLGEFGETRPLPVVATPAEPVFVPPTSLT